MAKFKAARPGKKKPSQSRGALPCIVFLISGMALLMLLFYSILRTT
jgi:hypothetical protein